MPKPLGVDAKAEVEIAKAGCHDSDVHRCLRTLYASLLSNEAVSGLALGAGWDLIETGSGTGDYDWSWLDDAFSEAKIAGKPITLGIKPGFDTPAWLLAEIPSCDGLFDTTESVPPDCGKVTFPVHAQQELVPGDVLPLPWSSVYENAWQTFLTNLNARYKDNQAFTGITIAGPTGATDEMILPTTENTQGAVETASGNFEADDVWSALIANSFAGSPLYASYAKTDQAFIDSWTKEIDTYEGIFTGVTLSLVPDLGNALPEYSGTPVVHSDNTLYSQECLKPYDAMSCEAKTEVLTYFLAEPGPNAKATHDGGLTARSETTLTDIGLPGVKLLDTLTPLPAFPVGGGANFDFDVSRDDTRGKEGCTVSATDCAGLTTEEAAYNVFGAFFYGTSQGASWGTTPGTSLIDSVEVPFEDVQYAQDPKNYPCPPRSSTTLGNTSMQDLLNRASNDLATMAGQAMRFTTLTCARNRS